MDSLIQFLITLKISRPKFIQLKNTAEFNQFYQAASIQTFMSQ